jgi:hypothetical protein
MTQSCIGWTLTRMKSINCSHIMPDSTTYVEPIACASAPIAIAPIACAPIACDVGQRISICIPRVDSSFTKEFIQSIFNNCQLGNIDSIDIVPNHKENAKFNRIFVHYSSMTSEFHLTRLLNGSSLKVVYEGPWFWKCVQSKVPRKK